MKEYEYWNIRDGVLEYYNDSHTYIYNGIIVPSVTQIMKVKFGNKYHGVSKEVLDRAAELGTQTHNAIENFCKTGEVEDLKEVRNFRFLQKHYKFEVVDNEVPIVLFKDEKPICAGRLDLVLKMNDEIGGGDIKRTSVLDKEYLAFQLNLYRIGYRQCYGVDWKFLKGIHLRDDKRKFVDIPINEDMAWGLINEYLEVNHGTV